MGWVGGRRWRYRGADILLEGTWAGPALSPPRIGAAEFVPSRVKRSPKGSRNCRSGLRSASRPCCCLSLMLPIQRSRAPHRFARNIGFGSSHHDHISPGCKRKVIAKKLSPPTRCYRRNGRIDPQAAHPCRGTARGFGWRWPPRGAEREFDQLSSRQAEDIEQASAARRRRLGPPHRHTPAEAANGPPPESPATRPHLETCGSGDAAPAAYWEPAPRQAISCAPSRANRPRGWRHRWRAGPALTGRKAGGHVLFLSSHTA